MKKAAAVFAMGCTLMAAAGGRAAPTGHTHTGAALHYRISYPAGWSPVPVQGADFAVASGNRNGYVTLSAVPGSADRAALRKGLDRAFGAFGDLQGTPQYQAISLHGTRAFRARALVTAGITRTSIVLAVDLSYRGHIYTLLGVVPDNSTDTATRDAQAVLTVLTSVVFS